MSIVKAPIRRVLERIYRAEQDRKKLSPPSNTWPIQIGNWHRVAPKPLVAAIEAGWVRGYSIMHRSLQISGHELTPIGRQLAAESQEKKAAR